MILFRILPLPECLSGLIFPPRAKSEDVISVIFLSCIQYQDLEAFLLGNYVKCTPLLLVNIECKSYSLNVTETSSSLHRVLLQHVQAVVIVVRDTLLIRN